MITLQLLITVLVVCLVSGTSVVHTLSVASSQRRAAGLWPTLGGTFGLLAAMLGLAAILQWLLAEPGNPTAETAALGALFAVLALLAGRLALERA